MELAFGSDEALHLRCHRVLIMIIYRLVAYNEIEMKPINREGARGT
jgi:hypothetical protein